MSFRNQFHIRTRKLINRLYINGRFNRLLRKFGLGHPLYSVRDREVLFEGYDHFDTTIFWKELLAINPWVFDIECVDDVLINQWIADNVSSRYWKWYCPIFLDGEVWIEDKDEAFHFRLRFQTKLNDKLTFLECKI